MCLCVESKNKFLLTKLSYDAIYLFIKNRDRFLILYRIYNQMIKMANSHLFLDSRRRSKVSKQRLSEPTNIAYTFSEIDIYCSAKYFCVKRKQNKNPATKPSATHSTTRVLLHHHYDDNPISPKKNPEDIHKLCVPWVEDHLHYHTIGLT